jgi:DNA-directed RNA polymerase specialized sigma subunit
MTPDVAKTLFTEWGKWQQGNMPNLDYSTINTLGRLKDEAGGASHSTCSIIPDMSVGVQQAEDAINKMDEKIQDVVKARYIKGFSTYEIADRTPFNRHQVIQYLDGAVHFFCGKMSNIPIDLDV